MNNNDHMSPFSSTSENSPLKIGGSKILDLDRLQETDDHTDRNPFVRAAALYDSSPEMAREKSCCEQSAGLTNEDIQKLVFFFCKNVFKKSKRCFSSLFCNFSLKKSKKRPRPKACSGTARRISLRRQILNLQVMVLMGIFFFNFQTKI